MKISTISGKAIERPKHDRSRICMAIYAAVGAIVAIAISVTVSVVLFESREKCNESRNSQLPQVQSQRDMEFESCKNYAGKCTGVHS